jgi:hypothetical protein
MNFKTWFFKKNNDFLKHGLLFSHTKKKGKF